MTMSSASPIASLFRLKSSRRRRRTALRITALPTAREIVTPMRGRLCSAGRAMSVKDLDGILSPEA
jgi:hypothetical protein